MKSAVLIKTDREAEIIIDFLFEKGYYNSNYNANELNIRLQKLLTKGNIIIYLGYIQQWKKALYFL